MVYALPGIVGSAIVNEASVDLRRRCKKTSSAVTYTFDMNEFIRDRFPSHLTHKKYLCGKLAEKVDQMGWSQWTEDNGLFVLYWDGRRQSGSIRIKQPVETRKTGSEGLKLKHETSLLDNNCDKKQPQISAHPALSRQMSPGVQRAQMSPGFQIAQKHYLAHQAPQDDELDDFFAEFDLYVNPKKSSRGTYIWGIGICIAVIFFLGLALGIYLYAFAAQSPPQDSIHVPSNKTELPRDGAFSLIKEDLLDGRSKRQFYEWKKSAVPKKNDGISRGYLGRAIFAPDKGLHSLYTPPLTVWISSDNITRFSYTSLPGPFQNSTLSEECFFKLSASTERKITILRPKDYPNNTCESKLADLFDCNWRRSQHVKVIEEETRGMYQHGLTHKAESNVCLSVSFRAAVEGLPLAPNNSYKIFLQTYGSHYVSKVHTGARWIRLTSLVGKDVSDEGLRNIVCAHYGETVLSSCSQVKKVEATTQIFTYGGDFSLQGREAFLKSGLDTAMKVEYTPVWDLISRIGRQLGGDKQNRWNRKASNMRDFVENYSS